MKCAERAYVQRRDQFSVYIETEFCRNHLNEMGLTRSVHCHAIAGNKSRERGPFKHDEQQEAIKTQLSVHHYALTSSITIYLIKTAKFIVPNSTPSTYFGETIKSSSLFNWVEVI
jgi:hypothetical protein